MKIWSLILLLLPTLASAMPEFSMDWEVVQDGTFLAADCKGLDGHAIEEKNKDTPSFDYCACTSVIRVPQMRGLKDEAIQTGINQALREAVVGVGCDESQAYKLAAGRTGSRNLSYFDVKLANTKLVSFLIWNDSYAAGAAHNSWNLQGMTFDLLTGKKLVPGDIIEADKFMPINRQIREELSNASFAEFAKEQLSRKEGDFLTPEGCNGCAFNLTREGMEVVFQLYEVAPYVNGNPKVIIYRDDLKPSIAELL
ncbi:MAG: RsiV family protein [Rickettsiales bacterium]|nr:RsiV family protein [Rickettsiales bacterium]